MHGGANQPNKAAIGPRTCTARVRKTREQSGWRVRMEAGGATRNMRETIAPERRGPELATRCHGSSRRTPTGRTARHLASADYTRAHVGGGRSRSGARATAQPSPRSAGPRTGDGRRAPSGGEAAHRQPPSDRAGQAAAPRARRSRAAKPLTIPALARPYNPRPTQVTDQTPSVHRSPDQSPAARTTRKCFPKLPRTRRRGLSAAP